MIGDVLYEQDGFFAVYSACGRLVSSWRKPANKRSVKYVEKLSALEGTIIVYGADFRGPDDSDEHDDWPRQIESHGNPPETQRPDPGDLL